MSGRPFRVEGHSPVTVSDDGAIRFAGVYVCDPRQGDSVDSLQRALDAAYYYALTRLGGETAPVPEAVDLPGKTGQP